MNPVVRVSATLAVTFAAMLVSTAALAVDSGDIVIVSLKGEVYVSMSGAKRPVHAGSVLDPPAILRTGRDGAVELRQGATTLSVGPETVLEFPALEKRGAPIDRIVQPRGNVFYNIGKREGRKLRIETPYLVGVVKGTQFNVAAQDETTTISLFEGLLEVHAADESGIVDLRAGEIASRRRDDQGVSVIKMEGGKVPVAPRQPAGSGSINSAPQSAPPHSIQHNQDRDSVLVDSSAASVSGGAGVATAVEAPGPHVDAGPASVDGSISASVSSPAAEVPTTTVDAGPVSVDTSAAASVAAPAVEVSTTTTVDTGPVTVDTGAAVSVGSPAVDATVTAGITAGPALATDLGVAAEAGSDSGQTRYTVVVGASNNQHEVTVGSANAAEAVSNSGNGNGSDNSNGSGNGNGNGSVAVTVNVGVDLGLDDATAITPSTDTSGNDSPGHGPPADVLNTLDGLLRRRGKK